MKQHNSKAFTIAETLVALSIIGILCITMLSLNSMSGNDVNNAATRLAQVDGALKGWGKAVTQSNETGLGASANITSQNALRDSLMEAFNNDGTTSVSSFETNIIADNGLSQEYNGATRITLNNGVTIDAVYNGGNQGAFDGFNQLTGAEIYNIAVLHVTSPVRNGSGITEDYFLDNTQGIKNLAELYEGWDVYENKNLQDGDTNGTYTCISCPEPASGTSQKTLELSQQDANNSSNPSSGDGGNSQPLNLPQKVYVKQLSEVACTGNQTGTIQTLIIGTARGTFNKTQQTCCPAPKVFAGKDENGNNICDCDIDKISITPGYGFDADAATCQSECPQGTYSNSNTNKVCKPCDIKNYCPRNTMVLPLSCEPGYYCPNATKTGTDRNNYFPGIFTTNTKGAVTEVSQGGLINHNVCEKGNICPNADMQAPQTCPAGHYCPNDGMTAATPCPKGTYNPNTGADKKDACIPCEKNTYQDLEGQTSCKECNSGSFTTDVGATQCSTCELGTTYDAATGECKKCPLGMFGEYDENNIPICTQCPEGTYQNHTGKTQCIKCPDFSSTEPTVDEKGNFDPSKPGAIAIEECKCKAGYGIEVVGHDPKTGECGTTTAVLNGSNSCRKVGITEYSPALNNAICTCRPNSLHRYGIPASDDSECICDDGYYFDEKKDYDAMCVLAECGTFSSWADKMDATFVHTIHDASPKGNNAAVQIYNIMAQKTYWVAEGFNENTPYFVCSGEFAYTGDNGLDNGKGKSDISACKTLNNNQIYKYVTLTGADTGVANNKCGYKDCPENSTPNSTHTVCLCKPGYEPDARDPHKCVPCPCGTFKSEAGNYKCNSCGDTSYTNGTGKTSQSECLAIPKNYVYKKDSTGNVNRCDIECKFTAANADAKKGEYINDQGKTLGCDINKCDCGEIPNSTKTACDSCGPNKYLPANANDKSMCLAIEKENYIPTENEAGKPYCAQKCSIECTKGKYIVEDNKGCHLETCPVGHICPCPGDNPDVPDPDPHEPILCPCGTYPNAAQTICVKCADNQYSNPEKGVACTNVPENYTLTANKCGYECKQTCDTQNGFELNQNTCSCECKRTCDAGQTLNTTTCQCENNIVEPECPNYTKLYVIRYKAIQIKESGKTLATLYQQMMGNATKNAAGFDSEHYKTASTFGFAAVFGKSDMSRNMPQEMKDAAEWLSDTDKNLDFTKYIAYIVGVNENLTPKAKVIAAFTPRTWSYFIYKNGIDESSETDTGDEDNEIADGTDMALLSAVPKSDFANLSSDEISEKNIVPIEDYISYEKKGDTIKMKSVYQFNSCRRTKYKKTSTTIWTNPENVARAAKKHINNGESFVAFFCKKKCDVKKVNGTYEYGWVTTTGQKCIRYDNSCGCGTTDKAHKPYIASALERFANATGGSFICGWSNGGSSTDISTCMKHIGDKRFYAEACKTSTDKNEGCTADEPDVCINIADDDIAAEDSTFKSVSDYFDPEKNWKGNITGYKLKDKYKEYEFKEANYWAKTDLTCEYKKGEQTLVETENDFEIQTSPDQTCNKICINYMNRTDDDDEKYSNFVSTLRCSSQKIIKNEIDKNYFDNGYEYSPLVFGCRVPKGGALYEFNYFEEYGDGCAKLCETDRAKDEPLCIQSCENTNIISNIFGNKKRVMGTSGYDKELASGGSIRIGDTCPAINVAYTFLRYSSPLVLDLLGNGLKFTSVNDGVFFDLDADGIIEKVAWTAKQTEFDDAFLIYDKNKNGQVDNGKELFGDQNGEENGFKELAKYDDNKDNVINKQDKIWTELRLWVDFNKNAKIDKGEIKTLDEANVTEIPLDYETKFDDNGNILTDIWGNIVGIAGHFKMMIQDAAGKLVEVVRDMIDVFFASN